MNKRMEVSEVVEGFHHSGEEEEHEGDEIKISASRTKTKRTDENGNVFTVITTTEITMNVTTGVEVDRKVSVAEEPYISKKKKKDKKEKVETSSEANHEIKTNKRKDSNDSEDFIQVDYSKSNTVNNSQREIGIPNNKLEKNDSESGNDGSKMGKSTTESNKFEVLMQKGQQQNEASNPDKKKKKKKNKKKK